MSDEPLAGHARVWACAQLEVAPDGSDAAVRRATWRRLAAEDFSPRGEHVEAIELVQHPEQVLARRDGAPAFRARYEQALGKKISALAGQFFDLPLAERKARWAVLVERAAGFPRQLRRLERIKPGLEVDLGPLAKAGRQVQQLGRWCGKLFTLDPRSRAIRKAKLLAQVDTPEGAWLIEAANRIDQFAPQVKSLAPDVILEVSQRRRLVAERARQRKRLERRAAKRTFSLPAAGFSKHLVWVAVFLGAKVFFFTPGSKPNLPRNFVSPSAIPQQPAKGVISVNAEDLIQSDNPWARVIELNRLYRVQVRATPEQVSQLKAKFGEPGFSTVFGRGIGDGVAKIVPVEPSVFGSVSGPFPHDYGKPLDEAQVTFDAEELLQDRLRPSRKLAEYMARQRLHDHAQPSPDGPRRLHVRATPKQVEELKQLMGQAQFAIYFGNGPGEGKVDLILEDEPEPPAAGRQ